MEFAKPEIIALEEVRQNEVEELIVLQELELALVGGGTGAISLG